MVFYDVEFFLKLTCSTNEPPAGLSGISKSVYTTCARKSIHLHQFKNIVRSSSLLCKSLASMIV